MRSHHLLLLCCCGECLEWSEGSDLWSGDRERLRRGRSCERLEWSDVSDWISEMSFEQTQNRFQLNKKIYEIFTTV